MKKIEKLKELSENKHLSFAEKIESINSSKLDLSIFLLLSNKEVEFHSIFPINEVLNDLDLLKDYSDPEINSILFNKLSDNNYFIIELLKRLDLFNEINQLMNNGLIIIINSALSNVRKDLMIDLIDQDLLNTLFKLSVFDSMFIEGDGLSEIQVSKVLKFIQEHSDFFTEGYFDSIEHISPQIGPHIAASVYPNYVKEKMTLTSFYEKYFKEIDELLFFIQKQNLKLSTSYSAELFEMCWADDRNVPENLWKDIINPLIENNLNGVIKSLFKESSNKTLEKKQTQLEFLIQKLDNENIVDLFVKNHGIDLLFSLYNDTQYKYKIPSDVIKAFNKHYLLTGDFSRLSDIETLNDFKFSQDEIINLCFKYIKSSINSYLSIYSFERLNNFDQIKSVLGKMLVEDSITYKEFEFVSNFLTPEEIELYYPEKYVNFVYSESNTDLTNKLLQNPLYKKEYKKILLKKLEDSYSSLDLDECFENGLLQSKDLISLLINDKITYKQSYSKYFSKEEMVQLKQQKKISLIEFVQANYGSAKDVNKIISKLEEYEIYGYNRHSWMGIPLDENQLDILWNKVKEKNNRDLKDFMFSFYSKYHCNFSVETKSEIYKRCSKLKGFEEILLNLNEKKEDDKVDNNTILKKKFTKELNSGKNILKILTNDDYKSILDGKNIKRALLKLKFEEVKLLFLNNDKFQNIISYVDKEIITQYIEVSVFSLLFSFQLPNFSITQKISFLKEHRQKIKDNPFYLSSEYASFFNIDPLLIHEFLKITKNDDIMNSLSKKSLSDFMASNYWTTLFFLNNSDRNSLTKALMPKINQMINEESDKELINNVIHSQWAFVAAHHDSIIEEELISLFINYSPKMMNLISSRLDHVAESMSSKAFKLFYDELSDKKDINLSTLLTKKESFSYTEMNNIIINLNLKQITNYFERLRSYNEHRFDKVLSQEQINLLVCEKNALAIPTEYWTTALLLSSIDVSADDLDSFFNKKSVYQNIYSLTKNEKDVFLQKLQKSSLNYKSYLFILKNKEVFNYSFSDLSLLFDKLTPDGITDIFNNFSSIKELFVDFDSEFKNKIFSVLETKKDGGFFTGNSLLLLAPKENNIRLNLLKNCKTTSDLDDALQIEDLSEDELNIICNNLISGNIFLNRLHYIKSEYRTFIINTLVDKNHYSIIDNDKKVIIFCGIEIALFEENEINTSSSLTVSNRNKIISFYKKTIEDFPQKINGIFFFSSSKFVPNLSQLDISEDLKKIIENLPFNLSKMERSDLKEFNILKSLIKFKAIDSMKAVAIRKLKAHSLHLKNLDDDTYSIKVEFDKTLLENCNKYYDNDLSKELTKKTSDLEKFLNQTLVPSENRKFGFELEMSFDKPKKEIVKSMKSKTSLNHPIIMINEYKSSSGRTWDFKEDGTIRSTLGYSAEIASPILIGENGVKEAQHFLDTLFTNFKYDVGEQTSGGLHVHHDIKDILKLKKLNNEIMQEFFKFQESIYALCDNWRQSNSFCSRINFSDLESDKQNFSRIGFNLSAYNTMEFRMRENLGSVNEIIRWIILTQKVVDSVAMKLKNDLKSFSKSAHEALDLIEKEKILQLKKIEDSQNSDEINIMSVLENFRQAQLFSKMMISQ